MKKLGYFIAVLCSVYSFTSCESGSEIMPSTSGKYVFNILQTLDTLDKESFRSNFITLGVIRESLKGIDIKEDFRWRISEMDVAQYNSEIEGIYDEITEEAMNYSIRWKDIEYVYYEYNFVKNKDITAYYGDLYFKKSLQLFKTRIYSFKYNDTIGLIGLGTITTEEERTFE